MNQMGEKKLEVLVNGISIGEIRMESNSHTTIVDGAGIILTGEYSMTPKDVEEMVYRKVRKNLPEQNVEIRNY